MNTPSVTDWISSLATLVAALVAAPAAVFAAIYTKRAAEAGAKAATEAANQVRELQVLRAPKALIVLRVPNQLTGEDQINYGRGNYQYRSGTPVYLDVWNVSSPTIMAMQVVVAVIKVNGTEGSQNETLTPQLLVESGKVLSINVAYCLMHQVSSFGQQDFINMPNGTTATARFTVKYISVDGERVVEADCAFRFCVTEGNIFTFASDDDRLSQAWGNYHFPALSGMTSN
jgi:hypothetical protein